MASSHLPCYGSAGLSTPTSRNEFAQLPSVGTWLVNSHRVHHNVGQPRIAPKSADCQDEDAMSQASTSVMSKATRMNLKRDKRKAAKASSTAQPSCSAPPVTEGGTDAAVQCNLAELEWQSKYDKLRKAYDEMKLELISVKGELSAIKRVTGFGDSDEEVANDPCGSEVSSGVDGFSDYGEGGGVGTKVIVSGIPSGWNTDNIRTLLDQYKINFIGIHGQKAAVFFDAHEEARSAIMQHHLTVLHGFVVRLRIQEDEAEEDWEERRDISNDIDMRPVPEDIRSLPWPERMRRLGLLKD